MLAGFVRLHEFCSNYFLMKTKKTCAREKDSNILVVSANILIFTVNPTTESETVIKYTYTY